MYSCVNNSASKEVMERTLKPDCPVHESDQSLYVNYTKTNIKNKKPTNYEVISLEMLLFVFVNL